MRCRWANLVTYLQQIWSRFFLWDEDNFVVLWLKSTLETCKKSQKWLKMILLLLSMKMLHKNCMHLTTTQSYTRNCFHMGIRLLRKHNNHITPTHSNISCNKFILFLQFLWGVVTVSRTSLVHCSVWGCLKLGHIKPFRGTVCQTDTSKYVTSIVNDTRLQSLSNLCLKKEEKTTIERDNVFVLY